MVCVKKCQKQQKWLESGEISIGLILLVYIMFNLIICYPTCSIYIYILYSFFVNDYLVLVVYYSL